MINVLRSYFLLFFISFYVLGVDGETDFNKLCDKCIPKCCPNNEYVWKRSCKTYHEELDITAYPVYTKDIYDTGKTLKDYFVTVPGRFLNETFKMFVYNINRLGFNTYLTENRIIYLELPNAFQRWTPVQPSKYCLDYQLPDKRLKVPEMKVWTFLEGEEMIDSNIYMTTGMIVSCVFLSLVLIVYAILPELRNLCGMVLMAYVASLLVAFALLVVIQSYDLDLSACLGLTSSTYFAFMATFCWMNVMSYDIWWTFRGYAKARPIHRRGERFKFCMYCLYGWGVPLLMTIFLVVINEVDLRHVPWFITPQIPMKGCFLEEGQKLVYMYVPMLIMNVFNWMFYLMTAYNIWRLSRGTAVLDSAAAGTPAAHRSQRHRFMVYLKLSVLMGLNWVLEVVSSFKPNLRVWYITDAYNLLIGVSIFLIFVCKKKIFRKLIKKVISRDCCGRNRWSPYSKSRSSSTTESNLSQDTPLQVCVNPRGIA